MSNYADDNEEMLDIVKDLLGTVSSEHDDVLQLCLDMTAQAVLNYCNISKLPSALKYTVCQMCAEAYRDLSTNTNVSSGGSVIGGSVSVIEEDGRKVEFNDNSTTILSNFNLYIQTHITHKQELNRFKKLYRIS